MKIGHVKIVIMTLIMLSLCVAQLEARFLTIKGSVHPKSILKKLILKKYTSMMENEFISDIPIIDKKFSFGLDVKETEVYMIENDVDSQFFTFIWDDNIDIEINNNNFYKSKVHNSRLTKELEEQDSIRHMRFIMPIKKLDTLLIQYQNDITKKPAQIDSVKTLRNIQFDSGEKSYLIYTNDYINTHPDSFISLFWLTLSGQETLTLERIEAYNRLSTRLKNHTRALRMKNKYNLDKRNSL